MKRSPLSPGDKPLRRKTPMQPAREPEKAKRKRPRNTGPKRDVKDTVKERAGYACEYCHRHLGEHGGEIHHRHGRLMGGTKREWINLPSNLLYLCPEDHRMVTDTKGNRSEYEAAGLLLREGQNPREVPILWFGQQKIWLLDEWGPGESGYWQPNPDDLPAPKASVESREDAA